MQAVCAEGMQAGLYTPQQVYTYAHTRVCMPHARPHRLTNTLKVQAGANLPTGQRSSLHLPAMGPWARLNLTNDRQCRLPVHLVRFNLEVSCNALIALLRCPAIALLSLMA